MNTHRTVIREPRFEQELASVQPIAELAEAAVAGLEWTLARNPKYGAPIGPEPIWATPLLTLRQGLLVYYTFDEETVTLISIVPAQV